MKRWTLDNLKEKGMAQVDGVYKRLEKPKVKKISKEKVDKVLAKLKVKGLDKLQ